MNMVERSFEFKGSRLNFVPTQYWLDYSRRGRIDEYCYQQGHDGNNQCYLFTRQEIDEFRCGWPRGATRGHNHNQSSNCIVEECIINC